MKKEISGVKRFLLDRGGLFIVRQDKDENEIEDCFPNAFQKSAKIVCKDWNGKTGTIEIEMED